MKAISKCITTLTLGFTLLSGCGEKVDAGADIAIAVKPDAEVLIGPGPISTCLDLLTLKTTVTPTIPRSAQGPVLRFNSFLMEWNSRDALYIQGIRYKVEGPGIPSGVYEGTIASDEVAILMGYPNGIIPASPEGTQLPIKVDSNASARAASPILVACGLVISGIPLTDGNKTQNFRARVTLEIVGSAENSEGKFRLIKQKFVANANYQGS